MRDRRYNTSILQIPEVKDSQLSYKNYVLPRINPEYNKYERHLPGANWAGPLSDVERRLEEKILPTTKVDRQTMIHDIQYHNIRSGLRRKTLSVPDAKKKIREADNELIQVAKKNLTNFTNPLNQSHAFGSLIGMKAKNLAEDMHILDELSYVGKGKKDPLRRLRKEMLRSGKIIN